MRRGGRRLLPPRPLVGAAAAAAAGAARMNRCWRQPMFELVARPSLSSKGGGLVGSGNGSCRSPVPSLRCYGGATGSKGSDNDSNIDSNLRTTVEAASHKVEEDDERRLTTTLRRNMNRIRAADAAALLSTAGDEESEESTSTNNKSSGGSSLRSIKAYSDLAKAKLSALVVTTTAAGFVAGSAATAVSSSGSSSDLHMAAILVPCVVGTFLCSASASAVNQIVEENRDALMKRTQARPLVTHALTVNQAKVAAAVWGVAGTSILYGLTDPTTAALGAGNWFLYSVIYTSMKPRSVANTWVGAVVGAIPPVMGYSAATSGMLGISDTNWLLLLGADGGGAAAAASTLVVPSWVLLAAGLYWWQLPHFFALSYMHRKDYARGGFRMISGTDRDVHGDWTAQCITRYSLYMATLPLVSTVLGMTTSMFAMEGVVLNAFALRAAYNFHQDRTNANARKVFLTSLWYLPCWLMLFLLHSTAWNEQEVQEGVEIEDKDENDAETTMMARLTTTVRAIRSKGREMCLHEAWATAPSPTAAPVLDADSTGSTASAAAGAAPRRPEACPIVLGTQRTHQGVDAVRAAAVEASSVTAAAVLPLVVTDAVGDHEDEDDATKKATGSVLGKTGSATYE